MGNSLADWLDNPVPAPGDTLRSLTYVGNAVDGTTTNYGTFGTSLINGDALANGLVSWTFSDLPIGDYTIMVGGADYAAQGVETLTFGSLENAYPTFGVAMTISVVPEPTSVALVGAGLVGAAMFTRRRRSR